MTLKEFIKAFSTLKSQQWIRSERKGPTGIGYTLEKRLGLLENNIAVPDLGNIELKAHRINSSSMITLFTFNRKAWKMKPLDAVRNYGSIDSSGRLGLYFTMTRTPNSSGLYLFTDEDRISVRHISGTIITEWLIKTIVERFIQKIPAILFVSAFSEMRGKEEWFKFERAQLLSGISADNIRIQLESGNILIDLRLHDQITRARNHGTGFRVREDKLPLIFQKVEDII